MAFDGFCIDNRKRIKILTKNFDEGIVFGLLEIFLYRVKPNNSLINNMISSLAKGEVIEFGKNDVVIKIKEGQVFYMKNFGQDYVCQEMNVDVKLLNHVLIAYKKINSRSGRSKLLGEMAGCIRGFDKINLYYGFDYSGFKPFALNIKSLLLADLLTYIMIKSGDLSQTINDLEQIINNLSLGDVYAYGWFYLIKTGNYLMIMLGESNVPYEYFLYSAHPYEIIELKQVFSVLLQNFEMLNKVEAAH